MQSFLITIFAKLTNRTRDEKGPHSRINLDNNIDNELYCSSIDFPNHACILLTVVLKVSLKCTNINYVYCISSYLSARRFEMQIEVKATETDLWASLISFLFHSFL